MHGEIVFRRCPGTGNKDRPGRGRHAAGRLYSECHKLDRSIELEAVKALMSRRERGLYFRHIIRPRYIYLTALAMIAHQSHTMSLPVGHRDGLGGKPLLRLAFEIRMDRKRNLKINWAGFWQGPTELRLEVSREQTISAQDARCQGDHHAGDLE